MNQPIKSEVINAVKNRIIQMLNTVNESLESERSAIQDETKSSAGDKYETQREMIQADIRRSEQQRVEAKNNLETIDHLFEFQGNIIIGTLVELQSNNQKMLLFIGPAVGDIEVSNTKIKTISQASPFGQLLIGKTKGEQIMFNQKSFTIVNCY